MREGLVSADFIAERMVESGISECEMRTLIAPPVTWFQFEFEFFLWVIRNAYKAFFKAIGEVKFDAD